jgi:hypothetical protein
VKARLVGLIHLDHPSQVQHERGVESRAYLTFDRGLKSGRLDEADLDEGQLIGLIESAAQALKVLRQA